MAPRSARLARFLIKTTLYGIWKFRNKATFHNSHEDSQAIIRYIKTDIRNRSPILHPPGNLHFVMLPTLLFMFFSSLVNFIVDILEHYI